MTTESSAAGDGSDERAFHCDVEAGESLSDVVVRAVASVSGRKVIASGDGDGEVLPPLYEAIDPDALDRLFRRSEADRPPAGTVRFEYCDHEVTVDAAGMVTVASPN